jgi:hypothetical protein
MAKPRETKTPLPGASLHPPRPSGRRARHAADDRRRRRSDARRARAALSAAGWTRPPSGPPLGCARTGSTNGEPQPSSAEGRGAALLGDVPKRMVPAADGGGGEAGTGSLGKSSGRIPFPSEGYTPRRRGDSARRVQWPEQGQAEVRTPQPDDGRVQHSAKSRKSPQAAGGEAADDRRPQGGISTRRPPADCSSTLPHEAGRWHVSGRSEAGPATRTDPPARGQSVTEAHVRELKNPAVAPECFRSAAQ